MEPNDNELIDDAPAAETGEPEALPELDPSTPPDWSYVKKLRRENASLRVKLRGVEAAVADHQAAVNQARSETLIVQAAYRHGLDPDLLGKLVTVEFDPASGEPTTDLDATIRGLVSRWAYLRPAQGVTTSATNPGRGRGLTVDDIKRWDQDTMNRRMSEAQEALRRNG